MDTEVMAEEVLEACGGRGNIKSNAVCMTRLRLTLHDRDLVDKDRLAAIHRVLGLRSRGADGIEIVFGPAVIEAIAKDFTRLTGEELERKNAKAITELTSRGPRPLARPDVAASSPAKDRGDDRPARRMSYAAQRRARLGDSSKGSITREELDALKELLEEGDESKEAPEAEPARGLRLLVINGPNLNMLGVREPDIYGKRTYRDLVKLCDRWGREAGFSEVRCFQSNHEGAIVDEIQAAMGTVDGIVMNPAAYTHTSVAILDALKAVSIPCVEVHISAVDEREAFRQVSYVRDQCIATITGEGFEGYGHAMAILAEHLAAQDSTDDGDGADGPEALEQNPQNSQE